MKPNLADVLEDVAGETTTNGSSSSNSSGSGSNNGSGSGSGTAGQTSTDGAFSPHVSAMGVVVAGLVLLCSALL